MYIYEHKTWPEFQWDADVLAVPLASVRHLQGRLIGRMESLGFSLRQEANLQATTQDAVKTSEIEGEILNPQQVRSSVAKRLGIEIAGLKTFDRNIDGLVEMLLDATRNHREPLTRDRLFRWHNLIFPSPRSGRSPIAVGHWRDDKKGPMQVVSNPLGRQRVHFQAPPAKSLNREVDAFLEWYESEQDLDLVLKSGIAHLWFVTIHPFDDGNGRIARAIADMTLARSEGVSERFYSMSAQIRSQRKDYYEILETTQRGSLDITLWLDWYFSCLRAAIGGANELQESIIHKARFWNSVSGFAINDRQKKVLNKILDGLEGKLTSSKWASLAKCSQDTATRDINDLIERGILEREAAGGRSTSYSIKAFKEGT